MLEEALILALSVLCLPLLYRLARGRSLADRVLALETISMLGVLAAIALSVRAGRAIYLDLAVLLTLFSFLGTLAIARYLERALLE